MPTHYCIWCLDNVCISLYYFLPPLEFTFRFQVPLDFQWSYLSERVKVNSLSSGVVAHPMTTRLVVRVKINNTTLCVSWLVGQCISHKNTTKIWNFQLLYVPLSSKFDNGLPGIAIPNTNILHICVITKLVRLHHSYLSARTLPLPWAPGPPPTAWGPARGRQAEKFIQIIFKKIK